MDQEATQTRWLEKTTVRSPALVSTPNAGSKNQSLRKTLLTDGASFEPNNEQTTRPESGIASADQLWSQEQQSHFHFSCDSETDTSEMFRNAKLAKESQRWK